MKTIMISDEAYRKLASIKGKRSFTGLVLDVVEGIKQKKRDDIMRFAGIMSNAEAATIERIAMKVRLRAKARV